MIPDEVTVNGVPFLIEEVNGLDQDGLFDRRNCVIQIDSEMPPQRKRVRLLHEVLRAVADDRNLHLEKNELDQLAKGLVGVLDDNPGLLRERVAPLIGYGY